MYFGWGLGYVNGFGMPNPLTYPNPQPKSKSNKHLLY